MRSHAKNAINDTSALAVDELVAMKERTPQRAVVEPLLSALGFTHITDTSGARERGKDLVALKENDFGRQELYAIQLKRFAASGRAASSRSFGHLLNQLAQSAHEIVMDPSTKLLRRPDRCLFFTPYPVPARVQEDYRSRMGDNVLLLAILPAGQQAENNPEGGAVHDRASLHHRPRVEPLGTFGRLGGHYGVAPILTSYGVASTIGSDRPVVIRCRVSLSRESEVREAIHLDDEARTW